MSKRFITAVCTTICITALAGYLAAQGNGGPTPTTFVATLTGFEETPQTLSSPASGQFTATVSEESIEFELSYANFQTNVVFAHIHLGAPATTGGVMVFLCNNEPPPGPPAVESCPAREGTVTGTLTAANVIGPTGQGIAPGEFEKVIEAIRAGAAYANVHSMRFRSGEIRGQIKVE